ncbi:MAG: hypothetical protein AAF514_13980 [Verrucomicrobiota bacterium]
MAAGETGFLLSSDGSQWETLPFPRGIAEVTDLSFGDGIFLALGTDWESTYALVSPDGREWTRLPTPSGILLERLAFGSGRFAAVAGRNGKGLLLSTPDGESWQWHRVDATRYYLDIAFGDRTWVLTGTGGAVFQALEPGGIGRIERQANGTVQLALKSEVGRNYSLLVSDDLASWRHLESFAIPGPEGFIYRDEVAGASKERYYRVKLQ